MAQGRMTHERKIHERKTHEHKTQERKTLKSKTHKCKKKRQPPLLFFCPPRGGIWGYFAAAGGEGTT